jgi:NADH-quinone oxidoreductase subunit A
MLTSHLGYLSILTVVVVAVGLAGAIIALNWLLGPKRKNAIKDASFECGSEPVGSARHRFSVKFYLVAIFFIVFDIESVFLYPWAALFRDMIVEPGVGWATFGEMFVFIGILGAGLAYVWRRGALDWE